jgi:hypothetical protein
MKTKILIAACLLSIGIYAQEKRILADFTKLQVSSAVNVYIQKSDTPYVACEADGVKAEIKGNTLALSPGKGNHSGPVKVIVGYTQLNEIEVTGASNVKTKDTLRTDNLQVNTSGASVCKLMVVSKQITCATSGASSTTLSGSAMQLNAEVSGVSSLKALGLQAQEVAVNATGVSSARVCAAQKLTGNTSGSSVLKYSGNPAIKQLNETGISSIRVYNGSSSGIKINIDSLDVTEIAHDSTNAKHYKLSGGKFEFIIHNGKPDTLTKKRGHGNTHNWSGIELAENGYLTPGNNISLPANADYMSLNYGIRNLSWNLNLYEKDFRFAHDHLQIVTGLGFSFNYFNLKNKSTLNSDSSYTGNTNSLNNSAVSIIKNKLRESFLTMPLMLELNTSKRKSQNFHIAAGVIGGLKIGSSTKQVFTENNKTYTDAKSGDYNLFPFKLDATVRVGYGNFTMFASYSLTPLFQTGKGPELYPFNVGIRIIPW